MNSEKLNNRNLASHNDTLNWDKEGAVEQIWKDMDGVFARATIEQVVSEAALRFEAARIKTFIPIIVHRETVNRLKLELAGGPAESVQINGELTGGTIPNNSSAEMKGIGKRPVLETESAGVPIVLTE